jgi:hypothetical protein
MPTTKPAKIDFTDAEKDLIADTAFMVWNECAYDLLSSVAESRMKDINAVTVSRPEAIEIALDAGRMEVRLRDDLRIGRMHGGVLTVDLIHRIRAAPYAQLIRICHRRFVHTRYGM